MRHKTDKYKIVTELVSPDIASKAAKEPPPKVVENEELCETLALTAPSCTMEQVADHMFT